MKHNPTFCQRSNITKIAEELLGSYTEVEAYCGAEDKACHAYGGKKSARNRVMFEKGGIAYVYICYGLHHLFNIVTHQEGFPYAILVRSLNPTDGIEIMAMRRKKRSDNKNLCYGPGNLTQALAIKKIHSSLPLTGDTIWIEDRGKHFSKAQITRTNRI